MEGGPCTLEILDTAGTEQFTAMRDMYMKNGHGFILVYSITSQASLNDLEDIRIQIIKIKDTDDIPMVLIGNKCDLESERAVSCSRGQELSRQWGCTFFEASAKAKVNVCESFMTLAKMIEARSPKSKKSKGKKCILL